MCWFAALGSALGASTATAASVGASATAAAATVAGTAMSAYSQYQAGKYNEKVANQNAEIERQAATNAIQRGADDAARVKENAKRIAASQRAGTAAGGVSVDTGSALDLLIETAGMSEMDARTTMNNAQRQAYGFGVQEVNNRAQGKLARYQGTTQAAGTILTGAAQAISMFPASGGKK